MFGHEQKDYEEQLLLEYLGESKNIDVIESQLSKIYLINWTNKTNTMAFWDKVNKYRDASGCNPFQELTTFASGTRLTTFILTMIILTTVILTTLILTTLRLTTVPIDHSPD